MRIRQARGFALIDLIFVCGIIGLLASMALPRLALAKAAAGSASAIGSLRAINSAELTFALTCGNGFYAPNLTTLGTPPPGSNEPFIGGGPGRGGRRQQERIHDSGRRDGLGHCPGGVQRPGRGDGGERLQGRRGSNGCRYRHPAFLRQQRERCDLRGRRLVVRRDARGRRSRRRAIHSADSAIIRSICGPR